MDFELQDQVGLGTFGKVYRARSVSENKLYALKFIEVEREREGFPVTAIREAKILKVARHPRIIPLERIVKTADGGGVYFVFPYFEYDLVGLLRTVKIDLVDVSCIMHAILQALCHLHSECQIMHRDIKPSNILINHKGSVVLADFGLAKAFKQVDFGEPRPWLTNRVVTLWYRAPELLLGASDYDQSVDIWALGCVFYELLMASKEHGGLLNCCLFYGNDEWTVLEAIERRLDLAGLKHLPWYGKRPGLNLIQKDAFSEVKDVEAKDLLSKMVCVDPKIRISAKAALDHIFFKKHLKCDRIRGLSSEHSKHEYEIKSR